MSAIGEVAIALGATLVGLTVIGLRAAKRFDEAKPREKGKRYCCECKYQAENTNGQSILCDVRPTKSGGLSLCGAINPNNDCEDWTAK